MIREVLQECHERGLTVAEGSVVRLSSRVSETLGRGRFEAKSYRNLLVDLVFDGANSENHDLAALLAWFLAQDPGRFSCDYDSLRGQVREQLGANAPVVNDVVYRDFLYWSAYLGFAKVISLPSRPERLMPDPTTYVERCLPHLFPEGRRKPVPLPEVVTRLAIRCPAFQGGRMAEGIRALLPDVPDGQLTGALSLALLRLDDRGHVRLSSQSDAQSVVLLDGPGQARYTHAEWIGGSKGGR